MIRYVRDADFWPGTRTWRLVEWCAARGIDEFSLAFMSAGVKLGPDLEAADNRLHPFSRGKAERMLMSVPLGQSQIQPTEVWSYSPESLVVLTQLFPGGLFEYPSGPFPEEWLEDPAFYRRGELMLGVVSHEGEGIMDLTSLEWAEFSAAGFCSHDRGKWI